MKKIKDRTKSNAARKALRAARAKAIAMRERRPRAPFPVEAAPLHEIDGTPVEPIDPADLAAIVRAEAKRARRAAKRIPLSQTAIKFVGVAA